MSHPLQPNREAPGDLGPRAQEEWEHVYSLRFDEAMRGGHAVFANPHSPECKWDADQHIDIFYVVGQALRVPDATPESIGITILRAMATVANAYASSMANDAAARVREDDDCRADDEWDRETT